MEGYEIFIQNEVFNIKFKTYVHKNVEIIQPNQWNKFSKFEQERRRAARQSSEESDKVVAEEVATDSREENAAVKATESERNAAEATSNDKVATDFRCEICDFKSNRSTGLQVHMSRKHATIEQLDGNTSLPYDVNEKVDEEVEHFLQYGFLRDPSVRVPRALHC